MVKDIYELISIRKNWISINRENNFENGIKNLLSNMYPDEAHFIYELLQNAEDKKAKHVYFKLTKENLIFEHDGGVYDRTQLFTLKDIESITGIGTSTKRDDNTTIGKFGVGFKAVFAYTETPQIHSGEYSFEINDLVVPKLIDKCLDVKEGITRFIFPLNSKTKDINDILSEIRNGLTNIKDNTLLFLKNIESISYELDNGSKGEFLRIDEKDNKVTLLGKNNEETYWLRFDKKISIDDEEDNKIKDCTINIAFKLKKIDEYTKEITPTNSGVSIFFPAEKEVSNLRFILNAPFASTIARDSVRNCKSNRLLIKELAIFIKEVLHKISEYGYMQMSFLKVLPNNDDDIPEMYMPILESIYEEYETQPYFITQSNELEYLKNVVKAYRAVIYELFSDDDINKILNKNNLRWLKNPSLDNSPESKFLSMFNIKKLTVYDLLSKKNTDLLNILKTKDNNWFYKLFKQLSKENNEIEDLDLYYLRDFAFMPTISKRFCLPNDTYYSRHEIEIQNINIISPEIFSYTTKDNKKIVIDEDIIHILEKLGVKEFDVKAKIEIILNKYQDNKIMNDEQNIKDVRDLIELSYNCFNHGNYWTERDIISLIERTKCIQGKNGKYYSLDNMVLGKPYKESFYEILRDKGDFGKEIISDKYDIPEDRFFKDKVISVCNKVGALSDLKIDEYGGGGPIGKDYYIPLLQEALNAQDLIISASIWNFLAGKNNISFYAEHKEHGSTYYSNFVSKLRQSSWLPNNNNEFFKPEDICIEDLPDEFIKKNILELVSILNIKSKGEVNKKLEESLAENDIKNLSVYDIQILDAIAQKYPQKFNKFIQENDSFDEEIRETINIEEAKNAKKIAYEKKEYSHRKTDTIVDAKPYLKNLYYLRDRDYMVCQICKRNMPFKKKDGNWYFEDVEMFKSNLVEKADVSTHISLCPTCSAKYKEYIKNNESQQLEIINEILYNKNKNKDEIKIYMDAQYFIIFKNKHFFDLKTKLPQLLNASIKDDLENEQKIKSLQSTLIKEDVHDSFINAEWYDIKNQNIIRIGYDKFRCVLFIDYNTGIEYVEKITKDIFNELTKNTTDIENYVSKLKDTRFSGIYKIK